MEKFRWMLGLTNMVVKEVAVQGGNGSVLAEGD
jgi:hypothetical protein